VSEWTNIYRYTGIARFFVQINDPMPFFNCPIPYALLMTKDVEAASRYGL
jgi:hypothetical protein